MKKSYHWRAILLSGLLFVLFSCDKEEFTTNEAEKSIPASELSRRGDQVTTIYGPDVEMGGGFVHSFVIVNRFKVPLELGVEMTPEVLNGLPTDGDFVKPVIVPLDQLAKRRTAFDHVEINWSPENYSTIAGFESAHFDFHFYMVPEEMRMEIPAWSEENEAFFGNYPEKEYMPVDYLPVIKGDGSYEHVGRYWLNNFDKPLSHTVALGTYDGAFIFISPISSYDFLKLDEKISRVFSQPYLFKTTKLYPREYNIYQNGNGNYVVSLGKFLAR